MAKESTAPDLLELAQRWIDAVNAGDIDAATRLFDMRMRGRSTGIDVPFGKVAWVLTYRGGLLTHQKFYLGQSEALKAVGLEQ